ncbi:glycosyltransferase family 9 protein [Roseivirga sp. BDSF3-8]|uniref:glycosyltransferase family 9 protein n=1 Tax=Roseivirga sp. BDSF3-8 TaxID=3241598 RepID=UPI00353275D6
MNRSAHKKEKIRLLMLQGGGDILLATPAIRAMKNENPDARIIVYVLFDIFRDILKHNPYIDDIRSTRFIENPLEFIKYKLSKGRFYVPVFTRSLYAYRLHATEMMGQIMDTEVTDKQIEVHLTQGETEAAQQRLADYDNTVAINITSRCSVNQMWTIDKWNRLVKEMPDHTFVQLGLGDEQLVEGAVDLRGKTDVRQAMAIVNACDKFVGVDSFLAHVSSAVHTPGVVLFGDSSPGIFGHANNINISKNLPCAPCNEFLDGKSCPYNIECMTSIEVDEVKSALLSLETNEVSVSPTSLA